MLFYFCIRSIGERTERICIDAIKTEMPDATIHIIKNVTPSYKAFSSMFDWAKNIQSLNKSGWLVAIDADTIMLPGWSKTLIQRSLEVIPNNTFKFFFQVYDPILEISMSRGHHVYNLLHIDKAYAALCKNINIIQGKKTNNSNQNFIFKPESSIRMRVREENNLQTIEFPEIIGIHGAEQYFCEIMRTFKIRRYRNPEFDKKFKFLLPEKRDCLIKKLQHDKLAANLGWSLGSSPEKWISIDKGDQKEINSLINRYGIIERTELAENYHNFCKTYAPQIIENKL